MSRTRLNGNAPQPLRAPDGTRRWTPGMMTSLRTDWPTPRSLFEILNREFHFVLDACATAGNAVVRRWIHPGEDALSQDWAALAAGGAIWMNPPYGRVVSAWIEKALRESRRGGPVVCLLPARTDTSWWHDYVLPFAEIRFLRGRLIFGDRDTPRKGRAPFPSVIVIFHEQAK